MSKSQNDQSNGTEFWAIDILIICKHVFVFLLLFIFLLLRFLYSFTFRRLERYSAWGREKKGVKAGGRGVTAGSKA